MIDTSAFMIDFWKWVRLPTHRFRRRWWGGCSMGPALLETKYGTITHVRTAREDTTTDQKGLTYVHIRYDDGKLDRYALAGLYHDKKCGMLSYSV